MKSFFSSLLGAFIGTIITSIIFFFMITGALSGFASLFSDDEGPYETVPNSILMLRLNDKIVDRAPADEFAKLRAAGFGGGTANGLDEILKAIGNAKKDEHIKGIFLNMSQLNAGMASVEEIRNALKDFKTSKKFIVAYSEAYTQGTYYLSSVADEIYVTPQGGMDFKGLSAQVMFYKGLLEKLNVSVQIFRHGRFKSAVEPFDLDKMSQSNREQTMTYVGSIWNHMLSGIAKERKLDVAKLQLMADSLSIREPQDAVDNKMVDGLKYYDEVLELLKTKAGSKTKNPELVTLDKYLRAQPFVGGKKQTYTSSKKKKIAVIYAIGQIGGGEGDDESIGSDRIARAIRAARTDSSIKAIVLRVNSPGGSALASDVIWRETVLAKKAKPFIVSMGDVAASGGYYIACEADCIVAQPNTITGSIGVFGMLPNAQKFFNSTLGITIDTVKTNHYSDLGTIYRPVTDAEGKIIQAGVENTYDVFLTRVADGRRMQKANVDSIGQGRVWSGVDAQKIGLVDSLGGLEVAIRIAARKAKLGDDYKITRLPEQKSGFGDFMKKTKSDAAGEFTAAQLGNLYNEYEAIRRARLLLDAKGVQARMGYDVIIE